MPQSSPSKIAKQYENRQPSELEKQIKSAGPDINQKQTVEVVQGITPLDYFAALYGTCTAGEIVIVGPSRNAVDFHCPAKDFRLAAAHLRLNPLERFIKVNPQDWNGLLANNPKGIGGADTVAAVVGLQYDIDAAEKSGKYLSQHDMRNILGEMPLSPSLIIGTDGTGGGLHVYWLLREAFLIRCEDDRQWVAGLSQRWLEEMRIKAGEGCIDGTANLDRYLRPLGTKRNSGNEVVALWWHPEFRYELPDFELPSIPSSVPEWKPEQRTEDSIIDRYLEDVGLSDPAVLLERLASYTHYPGKPGSMQRPGSQSGAPTGELHEANGRPGFTVKSAGAAPLYAKGDGPYGADETGWYSSARLYVTLEHDGDWRAAARHCHQHFDGPEPVVTIGSRPSETEPISSNNAAFVERERRQQERSLSGDWAVEDFTGLRGAADIDRGREIIKGLLREAEVCFVGSVSKAAKSWLVSNLAWSVVSGKPWLGMDVQQGSVLLVDNELRKKELDFRNTYVARAMQHEPKPGDLKVICRRGKNCDIRNLAEFVVRQDFSGFELIIVDAIYKTIPDGKSENDNAAMGQLMENLQSMSESTELPIVCVHHATKGDQSYKTTLDILAGAGSFARALDTMIAIREHAKPDMNVIEFRTRSNPDPDAISAQFEWPLWVPVTEKAELRRAGGRRTPEEQAEADRKRVERAKEVLEKANGRIQRCDLRSRTAMTSSVFSRILDIMANDGLVEIDQQPNGKRKETWVMSRSDS